MRTETGLLDVAISLLFRIFQFICNLCFWLIYRNEKPVKLPDIDNLMLLESASSLALKIRNRKVSLLPH